jgi:Protein of unknown function (DUF1761)
MLIIGIALATLLSFVASAAFYALPPVSKLIAQESRARAGVPLPAQMGSVVLRSLLTSGLVAGLMIAANWHGPGVGALLGLSLTILPIVLLFGSVIHEGTDVRVAAIHLTDWIVKLILIGTAVGLFL